MDAERGRSVQIQKKLRIRTKQISLRCATAALMALAALNMALNKQVSDFGSVKMEANYSSLSAFRFFVGMTAAVSAYSLLSLIFFSSWNLKMNLAFVLDLIATSLAMAALASSSAVAHIGKYGENNAGWPAVCGFFPHFCDLVALSLVLCFLGFLNSFLVTASLCMAMAEP